VIFPYAKYSAGGEVDGASLLGDFIKSPRNMPLYAMILAIGLRLYGINRPAVFFPVDVLLMISIGMYYLALGMSFSISDFFAFNMESLALSFIRFLLIPFITVIVLVLINLDPAIEAIILIESFMPAAVYSVMSSVLFGLDHRRASTMFVFNTAAFLLFILPMLLIFYKHLHRFVS
jgi:predicted permease